MKSFHFYKQMARELAPKSAVIFRHLVKEGIFPVCCRLSCGVFVPLEFSSSIIPRIEIGK